MNLQSLLLLGLIGFIAVMLGTLGCATTPVMTHGIPNFYRVSDGIWRSGQPTTPEGWAYVKSLGVKTVVKLNFEDEGSDDGARAAGLEVLELGIQPAGDGNVVGQAVRTLEPPDAGKVGEAVSALSRESGVLVHCTHGEDRTGLVVGLFRVHVEHALVSSAYAEMRARGFHPELLGLVSYWERATANLP